MDVQCCFALFSVFACYAVSCILSVILAAFSEACPRAAPGLPPAPWPPAPPCSALARFAPPVRRRQFSVLFRLQMRSIAADRRLVARGLPGGWFVGFRQEAARRLQTCSKMRVWGLSRPIVGGTPFAAPEGLQMRSLPRSAQRGLQRAFLSTSGAPWRPPGGTRAKGCSLAG